MFGKKQHTTNTDPKLEQQLLEQKLSPYEFHSMPEKFRAAEPVTKSHRLITVLAVVAVLIIAAGSAAAYLYFYRPAAPQQQILPEPQQPLTNTQEPQSPAVIPETPVNAAPQQPEPAAPAPSLQQEPVAGLDTDKDGLTDNEEEQLYRSQRLVPDTDNDGFLDGAEVSSGYSPIAPNASLLDSGLANTYEHPTLGYRVLYPTAWIARPGDTLSDVTFQSSTREQVRITAADIPAAQGFIEWYVAQHPGMNPNAITTITTRAGLQGIKDTQSNSYYLYDAARPGRVYILSHQLNGVTSISFATTFQLLVQSFKVGQ